MDDLLEFAFEIVLDLIGGAFDKRKNNNKKQGENTISIDTLDETSNYESYIVGLIATAIAISYEDDHKLDKDEKKMIKQLEKNIPYDFTKKAKKNLKYVRKHKLSIENLNIIYVKLNIDYYMMSKITNDIENIIKYSDKDVSKKLDILNKIRDKNSLE